MVRTSFLFKRNHPKSEKDHPHNFTYNTSIITVLGDNATVLHSWIGIWGWGIGGRGRLNYKRSQLQSQPPWGQGGRMEGPGDWCQDYVSSFIHAHSKRVSWEWSQRGRRRDPKTEAAVLCKLVSEVTCHHFCHILSVTQTSPGALFRLSSFEGALCFFLGPWLIEIFKNLFLFMDSSHSHETKCWLLLHLLWFLGSPTYHDLYSRWLPPMAQPPGSMHICCWKSHLALHNPTSETQTPIIDSPTVWFHLWCYSYLFLETSPGIVRIMILPASYVTCCKHSMARIFCLLTLQNPGKASLPEPIYFSSSVCPVLPTWNPLLSIILMFSFFSSLKLLLNYSVTTY